MCLFSFLLAVRAILRNAWRRGPSRLWSWFVYCCAKWFCQCNKKDEQRSNFDHTHPDYVINIVENLASVVLTGDAFFLSVFLSIYPFYITTGDLLALIMCRYPNFDPDNEMHKSEKSAIRCFLSVWMKRAPYDFMYDADMDMLDKLVDYVHFNKLGSDLLVQILSVLPLDNQNTNTGAEQEQECALGTQHNEGSQLLEHGLLWGSRKRLARRIVVLQEDIDERTSETHVPARLLKEETKCKSKFDHTHPDYVKNVVDNLADNVLTADDMFLSVFLSIYPLYTTTWDLLDMIMKRYPRFDADNKMHRIEKRAIRCLLSVWMKKVPQDFMDNADMNMLEKLVDYVHFNKLGSHLLVQLSSIGKPKH